MLEILTTRTHSNGGHSANVARKKIDFLVSYSNSSTVYLYLLIIKKKKKQIYSLNCNQISKSSPVSLSDPVDKSVFFFFFESTPY